jgi:hypothetical protein
VCWLGTLHTIDDVGLYIGYRNKRDDGATHFVFLAAGTALIKVPVNIERFPRLKVTHSETPIEVRGTIAEVGPTIGLDDATLSWLPSDRVNDD